MKEYRDEKKNVGCFGLVLSNLMVLSSFFFFSLVLS